MFNKIKKGEEICAEWNLSYIILCIFKIRNKIDPSSSKSVLPLIIQLFIAIIDDKIEKHINSFIEEHSGFCIKRYLLSVRQVVGKNKTTNTEVHMIIIDL